MEKYGQVKSDYHIHTKYSRDSSAEPEEILARAKQLGLKRIAITDHDTIKGGMKTEKLSSDSVEVVPGIEVSTNQGHLIGLDIREEVESSDLIEVCKEIKDKGGEVYAPHPFDKLRRSALGYSVYEIVDYLDYVEKFNGRCMLNRFNERAKKFAEEQGIATLSGSDAHFVFEVGNFENDWIKKARSAAGFVSTKLYKVIRGLS